MTIHVVLAGATGNLGPAILSALSASTDPVFSITVFTRHDSPTTTETNIKTISVDYTSLPSLTTTLRTLSPTPDAIISILPTHPSAAAHQTTLIHAAVAAGIPRFIPSEFGSDLHNPLNRAAPVYAGKVAAQELLMSLAAQGKISYTVLYTGAFLDWGLRVGFPINVVRRTAVLHDGGERAYSTTTLGGVGKAVVAILRREEETMDRVVRAAEAVLTLKGLLGMVMEVVGDEGWVVTEPDTTVEVEKASERIRQGVVDQETVMPFIYKAVWGEGHGGLFQETDNALLGIEMLSEDGIKNIIREVNNH
ncbi:hypothetical protein BJX61DRAFT_553036 [Aspergillus egyptiacus]|nr:hypothetical protein BJX61DRAFT_553036 [Aspergillus egyptiacus]